ncbi:hypothetical protein Daus18300_001402 [Diaporthe australafricana]|uniref:Arrestin C-terminal-like domain-containing protein n=1 Tax=Diaporthe australafricana TaxID=127596 RepID=A0ABR3XWY1_9PEZI
MSVATDTTRRPQPYYYSSRGAVYYTPRTSADRRARRTAAPADPSLPAPHIGPRQRRPHSIHIVSYPSGFIPQELRPKTTPRDIERQRRREEEKRQKEAEDRKKQEEKQKRQREQEDKKRRLREQEKRTSTGSFPGDKRVGGLFSKLKSAFQPPESQKYSGGPDGTATPIPRPQARTRVRPVSWLSVTSRLSRVDDTPPADDSLSPTAELSLQATGASQAPGRRSTTIPPTEDSIPEHEQESAAPSDPIVPDTPGAQTLAATPASSQSSTPATSQSSTPATSQSSTPAATTPSPSTMVDAPLRAPRLSAGPGIGAGHSRRNSFMSVRSAKSTMNSSVLEIQQPKPIASGSGLSCTIILAEPNVFLTGFDHDGHTRHESHNSTALLRGKLQLNVTKNTKVKSVTLKLLGKARTEWPEGIPPLKVDMYEEESLRTQALTFFHAMHDGWETEYGNQCTYKLKGSPMNLNLNRSSLNPGDSASVLQIGGRQRSNMSAKELKRLSLRSVESRSFGKGESPVAHQVQAKGFKVFFPGMYEYSFELPIDHHQLETIKLQYGAVKWELEAAVERSGAFKTNLHGSKEVSIVRVPDQMSLETSEPISISRQWEDQLHYDIMISGKSFPIGAKIPIAFKLTPLAKVQVHKLKVFVTEAIEYWTNDRKVTRKDPGRKILLLEKTAGKPLDKQYESSQLRILSGGELSPDERDVARQAALRRRTIEAQRTHSSAAPLPEPTENLLGDLDLGLETYWGSTEMEMNVQMPTCEMMAKDKSLRLHPDCSWKNVNVYHWMKIVMRISRIDPDDPAGKRRRHFEISIDSPFTVLNCRATQANTALPEYNSPDTSGSRQQTSCGCPDAQVFGSSATPDNSSGSLVDATPVNAALPMPPQAAHLHTSTQGINGNSSSASPTAASAGAPGANSNSVSPNPLQRVRDQESNPRPMHLLRYPSFDPPPFDYDQAPPPLPTPPPNYDIVVGTPSVDGLADYFQRLSHYEDPTPDQVEDDYLAAGASSLGGDGTDDITPPARPVEDEGEDTEVESDSDSGDERRPARTACSKQKF